MSEEYALLPNGYISKKEIRGYICYYVQRREGKKIKGFYIKENEVAIYEAKIEKRRNLKKSIRNIDIELKKIERAIN